MYSAISAPLPHATLAKDPAIVRQLVGQISATGASLQAALQQEPALQDALARYCLYGTPI